MHRLPHPASTVCKYTSRTACGQRGVRRTRRRRTTTTWRALARLHRQAGRSLTREPALGVRRTFINLSRLLLPIFLSRASRGCDLELGDAYHDPFFILIFSCTLLSHSCSHEAMYDAVPRRECHVLERSYNAGYHPHHRPNELKTLHIRHPYHSRRPEHLIVRLCMLFLTTAFLYFPISIPSPCIFHVYILLFNQYIALIA